MDILKYALIGGNLDSFIGKVHKTAIDFDPRLKLVAGCFSRNSSKNMTAGLTYGLSEDKIYNDYETLAKSEKDNIDFVVITSQNFTHYDIAKEFLVNGINVVCEKPLCFEISQAEELCKLAKDKGLIFAVTYSYTGYTMARVIKEMIENGDIGEVINVNAEYIQGWLLDDVKNAQEADHSLSLWRKDPTQAGISNCTGDIGTHIENFIHFTTGLKIKKLLATTNSWGNSLDLNANIILEYDNGANGAYWCSQVAAGHLNDLTVRIYGTKGSIIWEELNPEQIKYTPKDEATRLIFKGEGYIKEKAGAYARIPSGHPEGLFVAFANIYKDVADAIINSKNGKTVDKYIFPTVEDGLNGVKFTHAVINSGKNNSSWQEL
ncbi:MAG: Gfo/Idh/MocA family oxidoreductase [Clostridia bacterium]